MSKHNINYITFLFTSICFYDLMKNIAYNKHIKIWNLIGFGKYRNNN